MKSQNRKCFRVILCIELYVIDTTSIFIDAEYDSFSPAILDHG